MISAAATFGVSGRLANLAAGAMRALGFFQLDLAAFLIAYVLVRFCLYLVGFTSAFGGPGKPGGGGD